MGRTTTFDDIDGQILHALQCAPRAAFARIADVIGVSEQTVARRYQGMRHQGIVRVLGRVPTDAYGHSEWIARIRCRPDRVMTLAHALMRRSDVTYVHLASGGTDIICSISAPSNPANDGVLLQELPRTSSVLGVDLDLVLHRFRTRPASQWTGYPGSLTQGQQRALSRNHHIPDVPYAALLPQDEPLLAALAEDGRAAYTHLASATGWSKSKVARRLEDLEAAGGVVYDVDVLPERLGFSMQATLWLRVPPASLQQVGKDLTHDDRVAFVGAMSGSHNLMAVVICRDAADLYAYITSRLAEAPAITGYEVSTRARRLKQAGSIVAGGRLVPVPT